MQHGGGGGGGGGGSSSSRGDNAMVVAVRIRPMSPKEVEGGAQKCCKVINGKYVVIAKAGIAGRYLRSQQGKAKRVAGDDRREKKRFTVKTNSLFSLPTPYQQVPPTSTPST